MKNMLSRVILYNLTMLLVHFRAKEDSDRGCRKGRHSTKEVAPVSINAGGARKCV